MALSLLDQIDIELEARRRGMAAAPAPITFDAWLRSRFPKRMFDWSYMQMLIEALQDVAAGKCMRLMIFMPPRHCKSDTATIAFTAYMIERNPSLRAVLGAYNHSFATKFARKVRDVVRAGERVPLSTERNAAEEWETALGGGVRAAGVGAGVTGNPADLLIVDDPVKSREEANSAAYREKTWDWFRDDLYTRLEPGAPIILIMTRWHHDDLAGRILESETGGDWRVISLPALAEEGDVLGRAPGEALCPDRYPVEVLEGIRNVLGGSFVALYQQRPVPIEGNMFKPDTVPVIDALPAGCSAVRAWDFAATASGGDYTAGTQLLKTPEGRFIIADMIRFRGAPEEVEATLVATASRDGRDCKIREPQDPGQAGKSQVAYHARLLAGYNVTSKPVSGDKEVRAAPFASQVNVGNVSMLRASWNYALIEEMRAFPNGVNDDQVDALSDAFDELNGGNTGLLEWIAAQAAELKKSREGN